MAWEDIKPNSEYLDNSPRWQRVQDVVGGEYQLKKRDEEKNGTYLRVINPLDFSEYNRRLNDSYRKSAVFYNATGRTLIGLLGMLYRVNPTIPDLPTSMLYVESNIDGGGMGIDQQSHSVSSEVIKIGRHGLLVDTPIINDNKTTTIADLNNGFRPFVKKYNATDIIDWNHSFIDGATVLDLVILLESFSRFSDDFRINRETKKRYRILRLTDGKYTQQIWVEGEKSPGEEIEILDGEGNPFDEIPFEFIGSENNDSVVDPAPLESLADVNIGHLRNSADLEHSSFQLSAATPWIADDRYKSNLGGPSHNKDGDKTQKFGETSIIVMGKGGQFGYAQPSPNVLANGLAESKEQQMIALGAQLINESGGVETAEAVRTKKAADASMLSIIGINVSNGYTKALNWIAKFLNVDFEGEYQLNSNFFDTKLTAQERQQIVVEWQSGLYPVRIARNQLKASKIISIDEDLEVLQEEVDGEFSSVDLGVEN